MKHALFALILCLAPAGTAPGAALSSAVQDASCVKCKAKLKPNAKFCTDCGTKVEEKLCAGCKAPLKPDA